MTRCVTCGSLVAVHTTDEGTSSYVPLESDPKHVSIYDPALPEGQYRTETVYRLHDGRDLHLWLGRGKIVGNDLTHRPGRAL